VPAVLHVANGQATAGKLARAGLPGHIASHDDVLTDGPFPPDLPPSKAWSHRAGWMARHHGVDGAKYLIEEMALERQVARHSGDLVVWSDAGCLHCAMNLLHLLRLPTKARILLASPAGSRLGERTAAELAAVVPEPVPEARLTLAKKAARLVAAGDAAKLHTFVNTELAAWPDLQASLRLRLRMPRLLDTVILEQLEQGPLPFSELYPKVVADPALAGLGYGDASVRVHVKGMQEAGIVSFQDDVVAPVRGGGAGPSGRP
jgi:DNA-binding transcriptional ArsR family regulator